MVSLLAAESEAVEAFGSAEVTTGWPKGALLATGAGEAATLTEGLGEALLPGFDVSLPQPDINRARNPNVSK
jgi:hypothetical protein